MLDLTVGSAQVRALEPWRAPEFAEFMRRSGADLYEWLPWEGFEDEAKASQMLTSYAEAAAQDGRRIYGIWVDDTLVGGALFASFNARSGIAEVGVWLANGARGRGIVTGVVAEMVRWCFEERGLHRIEWKCAPGNRPSRAIPTRLGFTHEGTLRQAFDIRGTKVDLELWALLRDDVAVAG